MYFCRYFWTNQSGIAVSAELILIVAILVIGIVLALMILHDQVVHEHRREVLANRFGKPASTCDQTSYSRSSRQCLHGFTASTRIYLGLPAFTGQSRWTGRPQPQVPPELAVLPLRPEETKRIFRWIEWIGSRIAIRLGEVFL